MPLTVLEFCDDTDLHLVHTWNEGMAALNSLLIFFFLHLLLIPSEASEPIKVQIPLVEFKTTVAYLSCPLMQIDKTVYW